MLGAQNMPRVMEIIGTPPDVDTGSGHENGIFCPSDGTPMKMKLHVVTKSLFARAFHVVLVAIEEQTCSFSLGFIFMNKQLIRDRTRMTLLQAGPRTLLAKCDASM